MRHRDLVLVAQQQAAADALQDEGVVPAESAAAGVPGRTRAAFHRALEGRLRIGDPEGHAVGRGAVLAGEGRAANSVIEEEKTVVRKKAAQLMLLGLVVYFSRRQLGKRLSAELESRKANARAQAVLQTVREPIVLVDGKLQVVMHNAAFAELYGIGDEIRGERLAEVAAVPGMRTRASSKTIPTSHRRSTNRLQGCSKI